MKKSDYTPEQWEAYRAYQRQYYQENAEKVRAQRREQYQTQKEKVLARRREYNARPEVKAARRIYDSTPEKKAQRKAYDDANKGLIWAKLKSDPVKLAKHYADLRRWRTGMTAEQFDALMILQKGKCAICGLVFSGAKGDRTTKQKAYPCADHCHDGGGPRGILCPACNHIEGRIRSTGLGVLEFSERLHDYLLDPPFNQLSS